MDWKNLCSVTSSLLFLFIEHILIGMEMMVVRNPQNGTPYQVAKKLFIPARENKSLKFLYQSLVTDIKVYYE